MLHRITCACLCLAFLAPPCLAQELIPPDPTPADSTAARAAALPPQLDAVRDRASRGQAAAIFGGAGILAAGLFGLDATRGLPEPYGKARRPWICLSVTGGIMLLVAALPMGGSGPVPVRLP
jgi:hypothetical protein